MDMVAVVHFRIFFVWRVRNSSHFGAKILFCLVERSNELMNDMSEMTQMMKRCIDVKRSNDVEFPIQET
jgi:hypothetical protein